MRERGLLVDPRSLRLAALRAALLFFLLTALSLGAIADLRLFSSLISVATLIAGAQLLVAGSSCSGSVDRRCAARRSRPRPSSPPASARSCPSRRCSCGPPSM